MDTQQMQMVEDNDFNLVRWNSSSSDQTDLNSLSDDILMQILIRIPAQHIVDTIMFVCWKWRQLIRTRNFRLSHVHHSTSGLLIPQMENSQRTFISMTQAGQIDISTTSYAGGNEFWTSFNGLMLSFTYRSYNDLIIRNLVTRKELHLPSFISSDTAPPDSSGRGHTRFSALSFVANPMEYKVVRAYRGRLYSPPMPWLYCAILTIGADKSWRRLDTQHLCFAASKRFGYTPLVTEGFVHWVEDSRYNLDTLLAMIVPQICDQYVLTLNVETEIITQIPAPPCNGGYYYTYFSGGSYLSMLIGQGFFKWEVWEMKPETREWIKLPDIDLEAHKGLLNERYDRENSLFKPVDGDCKLMPAGWLEYRQVIVLAVYKATNLKMGPCECHTRLHAVYNVQTQSISFFTIEGHADAYLVHRNSLIDLQDCIPIPLSLSRT